MRAPRRRGWAMLSGLGARLFMRERPNSAASGPPKLAASVYVGSLVINLLALGMPLVILQVYDRILPNQATDTLLFMVAGLCGVIVLDTLMKLARAYVVGFAAARWSHERVIDGLNRILYAHAQDLDADAPSVHVDRLNAIDALRDFHGGQSRLLLLDLPFVVIFLGLIAFIGGQLVAVPLALFAILGLIVVTSGKALQTVLERRADNDDKRHDFIIESLSGIYTIKALAMEPQIQRRYERLQNDAAEATYRTIILGNAAQSFGNLFANLTMISVVTVGALMVIEGGLTIGTLAACTLLSGRAIQPVLKGLMLWTQMQSLSVAHHRVDELFRLPPSPAQAETTRLSLRGAISFRGVNVMRRDGTRPLFHNLDLDVAPGEFVGIKGAGNSGKSALLKAITGEIAISGGEILIDGHPIDGPARVSLRRQIAYLPAHSEIFQGTILENIAMFRTGDAIDAARDAARLIGLEPDIHKMPEGYDTQLSEGISEAIPAGMMQRIVIARALALHPRVLLFDEANAQLDPKSDTQVRDGLARLKGEVTVLIVSQRPSFLKITDRILIADGGRFETETGSADHDASATASMQAGAAAAS